MELSEAIRKLRLDVDSLDVRRAELASELEGVDTERGELLEQAKVLEAVASRYGVAVTAGQNDEAPAHSWASLNRQEAVLRALRELDHPSHLREVVSLLRSKGRRDDSLNLISAALSTLRRKGRVHPVGAGVWRLAGTSVVPVEKDEDDRSHHWEDVG